MSSKVYILVQGGAFSLFLQRARRFGKEGREGGEGKEGSSTWRSELASPILVSIGVPIRLDREG